MHSLDTRLLVLRSMMVAYGAALTCTQHVDFIGDGRGKHLHDCRLRPHLVWSLKVMRIRDDGVANQLAAHLCMI